MPTASSDLEMPTTLKVVNNPMPMIRYETVIGATRMKRAMPSNRILALESP